MRTASLLGGFLFSICIAGSGIAHAGGGAPASQQATSFRQSAAQGARMYKMKPNGFVLRTSLPGHGTQAADRIKVLKQSMEDEIEGKGGFVNEADTPAFEIVAHNAHLHQVAEAGYHGENEHQNHGVARYQVKASDLKGGKLDVTALLPVSGHVGISSAQNYARTNVFRMQVNGSAWENVPAKGQYITERRMELSLKPGVNTIMMEPYAGGFSGYTQGRTVEIEVVP